MPKILINVGNFKKCTILLICLLKIHSVLSECSDDEWDCDDRSCIPLQKKCDGIVDCADRSDEIAENCIQLYRSCQDFAFTCTYGACIEKSHRCNGKQDCSDNSDELVCPKSWKTDLQGRCGPEQLQCLKSKECIDLATICDGQLDCSDGSDETVEVCAEFKCPEVGFHCGYGGCINSDAQCNGKIECPDGSDEAWELCKKPRAVPSRFGPVTTITKTPTPRPTPTPTPTPRPTPTNLTPATTSDYAGCQIPFGARGSTIRLHPSNTTISPGAWVEDSETVHVECNSQAAISRFTSLICYNGKFDSKFPRCGTYCDDSLLQGVSTIYHCYRNGYYVAPELCRGKIDPTTEIRVICAYGYKRVSGDREQIIQCLPDGTFNATREKCEASCGHVQLPYVELTRKGIKVDPNEVPWHVAIYELDGGEYSFICGGSVISPSLIISAAHCFWDRVNQIRRPIANYQFMAGKYTRGYSKTGDEMPQIRDAVDIQISKDFAGESNYNNADVALIKLKEPLVYNYNISSVCIQLSEGLATDYVPSGNLGSVTGYGRNNTLEQVPMKTIAFHTCLEDPDAGGLTRDKFCLTNDNDMSICRGDSGGGFVVKEKLRNDVIHYILGIISYTPSTQQDCARDGFVGVTNVRYIKSDMIEKIKTEMRNDNWIF